MNNSKDCVVVIPTHKSTPSAEEERSLRNTLRVLCEWDITLLLPHNVSHEYYNNIRQRDNLRLNLVFQ